MSLKLDSELFNHPRGFQDAKCMGHPPSSTAVSSSRKVLDLQTVVHQVDNHERNGLQNWLDVIVLEVTRTWP